MCNADRRAARLSSAHISLVKLAEQCVYTEKEVNMASIKFDTVVIFASLARNALTHLPCTLLRRALDTRITCLPRLFTRMLDTERASA